MTEQSVYPTAAEVAWAAGIFEGEGWFSNSGKNSGYAALGSTDRDVVERFLRIVQVGRISKPMYPKPEDLGNKPMYRWYATKAADVKKLIALLLPWFGERRKARAEALLTRLQKLRPRTLPGEVANQGQQCSELATHCGRGHEYTPENTAFKPKRGTRYCRECAREYVRQHRRRKKDEIHA